MTNPTTMRAAAIDHFGGLVAQTSQRVPVPDLGAGGQHPIELGVEVAGVGKWDPFEREGGYAEMLGLEPPFPDATVKTRAPSAATTPEPPDPVGRPRLAERVEAARAALDAGLLTRLFVRRPGGLDLVATADIVRVDAQGDYALLRTRSGGRHLVYISLNELEARLDPRTFLRVHRSHIVNLDRVRSITAYDESRFELGLDDGSGVVASRSRSRLLRDLAR